MKATPDFPQCLFASIDVGRPRKVSARGTLRSEIYNSLQSPDVIVIDVSGYVYQPPSAGTKRPLS